MSSPSLFKRTLLLLRERPRAVTLESICDETGLSMAWLSTLIKDPPPRRPDVNRIEVLYNHLSDTPLFPHE